MVIDAIGIREGGGAGIVRELSHWLALARPRWQFHLLLFPRAWRQFDDPPTHENLVVEHVARGDGGLGRLRWVNRGMRDRLSTHPADVVLSLANIGAARPAVPQVVYLQQMKAIQDQGLGGLSLFRRARFRFMRHFILRGARASDAIIVQTEAMKHMLSRIEPALDPKIRIIPGGVGTLDREAGLSDATRQRLAGVTRPWLFYPSMLREHKNHRVLLDAMPLIRSKIPSASLLFTVRAEVRWRTDGVVCLDALLPGEVDALLRQADLMAFPSLSESFGLPLAEALSAGCPIAAADLPYAHEVCADTAVYFDPKDPADLAKQVVQICNDSALRARLRSTTAMIATRYQYSMIAEQMAVVLTAAADR